MSIRRHPAEFAQAFGHRLLEVLSDQRLSQQDLAKRLESSPGFISALVRGLKVPGTEFLVSLHQALRVSLDWLCTGTGSKYGAQIDGDLFQGLLLQVQLVRLATVERRPEAVMLLRRAIPDLDLGHQIDAVPDGDVARFLQSLLRQNEDVAIALSILNRDLLNAPEALRSAALARAIKELVQSKRELSILSLFSGSPPPERVGALGGVRDYANWDGNAVAKKSEAGVGPVKKRTRRKT